MNSKKKLFTKCAIAIAMVPFNANATTAQTGLEACADALVTELSMDNGSEVNYRLDSANEDFDRTLRSPERISLYARDPHSSELVSRMDCLVSRKGRVIRLTKMPLVDVESGNQVSKID